MQATGQEYFGVEDTAERCGVSATWVRKCAQRGRIPGALKVGKTWAIPAGWTPERQRAAWTRRVPAGK
ncbi:MAG: helix-turn-helix domain-containing protein [Plesiomonas shigelloides]